MLPPVQSQMPLSGKSKSGAQVCGIQQASSPLRTFTAARIVTRTMPALGQSYSATQTNNKTVKKAAEVGRTTFFYCFPGC